MPKAIKLLSNNKHPIFSEVYLSPEEFQNKLTDPAQLSSPALIKLGFPITVVPSDRGRKLITGERFGQFSNQRATYAVANARSGLAASDAVGDAYLLRTDGKDLTLDIYSKLDNSLFQLMDVYSEVQMTDEVFAGCRSNLRAQLRHRNYRDGEYITRDEQGNIKNYEREIVGRVGDDIDKQSEVDTAAALEDMEAVAATISLKSGGSVDPLMGPAAGAGAGSTVAASAAGAAAGPVAGSMGTSPASGAGRSTSAGLKRGFLG